jgi:FMN phosphatase YigB (HAD superfamily)
VIKAVVFDVGETLVDETPFPAGQIVYVGDRLDNDLRPAKAAGLRRHLSAASRGAASRRITRTWTRPPTGG